MLYECEHRLAVVIPAYKAAFLDKAVRSVIGQTDQRFSLFIFDDGSPEDLSAVVSPYLVFPNVHFRRFEHNLGRDDLTKHWDRCIRSIEAEWIWLFSDDDIMAADCIARFWQAVASNNTRFDLYRFNIEMIDAQDRTICAKAPHPEIETGIEFVKRRLRSLSLSAAAEYIFRKAAFIEKNGFVSFPLAFCSDDATWARLAGDKGVYTIPESKVLWRSSDLNVSSRKGLHQQKITALVAYSAWVKELYQDVPDHDIEQWLFESLKYVNGKLNWLDKFLLAGKIAGVLRKRKFFYFTKLLRSEAL